MRREWVLAQNGVCQADLGSLYKLRLVKALNARVKRRIVEIDPGLETYKRGKYLYILLAVKEGCRCNNFTDEWNAQIVSTAATKLRKHIQKWKIKCLFKALPLTIVLKMQCHLFMNSLVELVLRCFENSLSTGTAALV